MPDSKISEEIPLNSKALSFDEVFNLFYPRLVLFTSKFVGSKEDAEEVVQEMFVKFWEKDTLSSQIKSLKSFLFKSAFNASIDFRRRHKRDIFDDISLIDETDNAEHFNDRTLIAEVDNMIKNAINSLPEKRRIIFQLNREKGLSYSQIAVKLSISKKTVETQMGRSLIQLRKYLSDYLSTLL
ncbi:MAG: RNA polymerase sigma-70 factor [Carboxylicivirga sp.]|jgi:RNA polymerase sigma-70 factor (ECF subfamily)|nr:RNA polymerase sigma-70 factor [Carboxylicivirga sp.]